MISQWENECISLSVLSMALVMISQWENECISLSVLSVALVMISQWKNECISRSVLSVALVMISQWKNECISLSVLPDEVFQGSFPWLITRAFMNIVQAGPKERSGAPLEKMASIS